MSRVKFGITAALIILLGACSLFEPFVDRRRNAGEHNLDLLYTGRSKIDAPAVCYNSWTTSFDEVKKLADEECRKHKTGTYAELSDMSSFTCRLLVPNHVYFKCVR